MEPLSADEIRRHVQSALAEDMGSGDVTTLATVPESAAAKAFMVAREAFVVAGLALAEAAFRELSPAIKIVHVAKDGQPIKEGQQLMSVEGSARAMLSAERVA